MNVPRNRAAAGVIDDRIYVAGGANGSNCLNSVERYFFIICIYYCKQMAHKGINDKILFINFN